jgi:NAD(P)-dependent dehydrogenase (short-subunit alcohol dehydrogenase family)
MSEDPSLLVTGGGAGLGAAIGAAAAAAGYRVGLLDVDATRVEATAATLDRAVALVGSTTDVAAVEAALDTFGTPDVLVNNAGIVRFGPLVDLAEDEWRAVVDVNLTGTFVTGRSVAKRMLAAGHGTIVNISSMNGVAAGANSGAYGPTKAAVGLLTEQMALEWAPTLRVNAVAPGLIDAGMSEQVYADPATRTARESRVPLGRLGRADDVAAAVLWLASDRAGYVTGQTLLVDGGVTGSIITTLPRPQSVDGVGHRDP